MLQLLRLCFLVITLPLSTAFAEGLERDTLDRILYCQVESDSFTRLSPFSLELYSRPKDLSQGGFITVTMKKTLESGLFDSPRVALPVDISFVGALGDDPFPEENTLEVQVKPDTKTNDLLKFKLIAKNLIKRKKTTAVIEYKDRRVVYMCAPTPTL